MTDRISATTTPEHIVNKALSTQCDGDCEYNSMKACQIIPLKLWSDDIKLSLAGTYASRSELITVKDSADASWYHSRSINNSAPDGGAIVDDRLTSKSVCMLFRTV